MLNINVTITNRPKSQLKQKVTIRWAVFTELWAVLDLAVGRFGPGLWAVLVHGPFWSFPVTSYDAETLFSM